MAKVINILDHFRFGHHEPVITNGSDKPSVSCGLSKFGNQMDLLWGDPTESEPVELTWWDSDYKYRRKMNIYSTVSGVVIPSGTTVIAHVDVDLLEDAGKCLANYNDVRIVRYTGAWEDLPRDYLKTASHLNVSTLSSKFLFKTTEDILTRDDSYYLYYGNPAADAPISGAVSLWDYQDDFDDAPIGGDWTTSGTGNFSETGGYAQIQHTSVAYAAANGGWDDCPLLYKTISNDEIVIETKIIYETNRDHHAGLFISDATRTNAIMLGLRDSANTLYVMGAYVTGGRLTNSGTVSGAVNYYYRICVTKGGVNCYYSSNGITWTLYGAYNLDWDIKWVGLFERNIRASYNNNYMRFEYFYMTNRQLVAGIDEESPQYGERMRGGKRFVNGTLVPFLG